MCPSFKWYDTGWCAAENNSWILSRNEPQRNVKEAGQSDFLRVVPQMWRGQERVTNERKKCGSRCVRDTRTITSAEATELMFFQIWACPPSSSLRKSKAESAVLCLKWGEFVMCAADPPLLSGESSGSRKAKQDGRNVQMWTLMSSEKGSSFRWGRAAESQASIRSNGATLGNQTFPGHHF